MRSSCGRISLTYNGEVYNAPALRSELAERGCTFESRSDSEVILRGYSVWGRDVVRRLSGIFAFAILDERRGAGDATLLLARDPLGVKPLYYTHGEHGFAFASELRALRASGLIGGDVDPAAIVAFLLLGSVPDPVTIYQDAMALEPGNTLEIGVPACQGDGPQTYWTLPTNPDEEPVPDDLPWRIRELLEDAVRSQLVSDVPLGAFLSGGLDSSAVVALMRQATAGPIRTCSIAFEEPGYGEQTFARAVVNQVGAEHHERVISRYDFERELDRVFDCMDQPTVDGVNTYFVSQTARQAGLSVALSGLGGDELFAGYRSTFAGVPRFLAATQLLHALPFGNRAAALALESSPRGAAWAKATDALRREPSPTSAYLARRGVFAPSEIHALVGDVIWHGALRRFDPIQHLRTRSGADDFGSRPEAWVSRTELATYTCNQLLRDTDVMSMAHSLEVRVPLLDQRLVDAVLRLPRGIQSAARPKQLLLAAVGDLLPSAIRRRDKQGFVFPFDRWLRRGGCRSLRAQALEGSTAPVISPRESARTWLLHEQGKVHWSRPWSLFVLQQWLVRHIGAHA